MKTKTLPLLLCIICFSCVARNPYVNTGVNYREEMRNFVIAISQYGKSINSDFAVIPQNGWQLIAENGANVVESDAAVIPANSYLAAIDGLGCEEIFYGVNGVNEATPTDSDPYQSIPLLDYALGHGKKILVIDYATGASEQADSWQKNQAKGYLSARADREADSIIDNYAPAADASHDCYQLSDCSNFAYWLNPDEDYSVYNSIKNTYFDCVVIDHNYGNEAAMAQIVTNIRTKPDGKRRMVIAYVSIGEAENYRGYWDDNWGVNYPPFIVSVNPNWPGNYKVKYWDTDWQAVILDYIKRVADAGFDGVYLDIIDAFHYWEEVEELSPLSFL